MLIRSVLAKVSYSVDWFFHFYNAGYFTFLAPKICPKLIIYLTFILNETTVFVTTTNHWFNTILFIVVDSNEGVTPLEILEEKGSPQNKALQWIV